MSVLSFPLILLLFCNVNLGWNCLCILIIMMWDLYMIMVDKNGGMYDTC